MIVAIGIYAKGIKMLAMYMNILSIIVLTLEDTTREEMKTNE